MFIAAAVALTALLALYAVTARRDRPSDSKTYFARITLDGSVERMVDLSEDGVYHIDALYDATLEVKDGSIRFIDSVCPNHDCELFGRLSSPPETAVCLPAKISVQIVESE